MTVNIFTRWKLYKHGQANTKMSELTGAVSATASLPRQSSWKCSAALRLQCCELYRGWVPSVSARGREHWRRPGQIQHRCPQTHWHLYMTQAGSWADEQNLTDRADGLPPHSSQWNVSSPPDTESVTQQQLQQLQYSISRQSITELQT